MQAIYEQLNEFHRPSSTKPQSKMLEHTTHAAKQVAERSAVTLRGCSRAGRSTWRLSLRLFMWVLIVASTLNFLGMLSPQLLASASVYREPPEPSLEDAIEQIGPRFGIEPALLSAIAEQESGNGFALYARNPKGEARMKGKTERERAMLSAAHGPMQVRGVTAKGYGIPYYELYRPSVAVAAACKKLNECEARFGRKVVPMLRCYYGLGQAAAGQPTTEQYADQTYQRYLQKKGSRA